jgi:hypothetical protein
MNSQIPRILMMLDIVMILMTFGCCSKENDLDRKKLEYNKKIMGGLGGNKLDTTGVKLLPIR